MNCTIRFTCLVAALLTCLAQAAPPQTLDYQGYLANSGGVPLTGMQNLSVSLYDVATDGSPLWTQASSPIITNGRFSLVLDGSGTNPFPTGLFDQQIYVGLTVGADPEMFPRQPLTSVPSAFEAHNSDTVDGMQANEIIDAASDEVRIPISSLPFTISQPGSYYLTNNLNASQANSDLIISSGAVTIDLMGFAIVGNDDQGISISSDNVTIVNGIVYGITGIWGAGDQIMIANMDLRGGSNINLTGEYHHIFNVSLVGFSPGGGITVGDYSIVRDSLIGPGTGSGISAGRSSQVVNNTVSAGDGQGIGVGDGSLMKENQISGGSDGCGWGGEAVLIIDNNFNICYSFEVGDNAVLSRNTGEGSWIEAGNGALISHNSLRSSPQTAIVAGTNSYVTSNVVESADGSGIAVGGSSTVRGNTVTNSNAWGIIADNGYGSIIKDNNVAINSSGGLRIGWDSVVENNKLDDNNDFGILVVGRGNVLRQNHVTDITGSGYCYRFEASGNNEDDNAIIENTANGCNQAFSYINGNAIPASRNVGNIAW